ncbi:MAG TPA: protein-glutamate O-methyltransferase CheR [Candidatus Binataceae bacterium]|nr:protein-glutamate O-methyltransferase CheR [Candidatus Binataceae bacterium]
MAISHEGFDFVRKLVHSHSGVVLDAGKEYLVESRLQPLAQNEGLSVQNLIDRMRLSAANPHVQRVVEALTTNETLFFRDMNPFEELRKVVLPQVIEKRRAERRLTIWSAACSTGQEPYSIAMMIREHFPEVMGWSFRLMASDIAGDVLARARVGHYSQLEVSRGLPASYLVKNFRKSGAEWHLNDEIRRTVEFFEMNLTKPWPMLPRMDIILIRNVLIYFDLETKRQIFTNLRHQLHSDGWLALGGSETTLGVEDAFERVSTNASGWFRLRRL